MSSITTWNRIEPRVRGDSLSSLDARVYDASWLLGRQWQVGEFEAEDAGSAVAVRLTGSAAKLSHLALGAGRPGQPYNPMHAPLDALVEQEPQHVRHGTPNLRLSARAGLRFWNELERRRVGHLIGAYLELYPIPDPGEDADAVSGRAFTAFSKRVPDGLALGDALRKPVTDRNQLPSEPKIRNAKEREAALEAARALLAWLDAVGVGAPAGSSSRAWAADRLEYGFAVGTKLNGAEQALVAPEHRGGSLDWYSFDADPAGGVVPGRAQPAQRSIDRSVLPQPARYAGMPRPRYWEMEDGQVNFGSVETGPTDLTRMLLIEFALIYGNDFLVVPLTLELGDLARVESVVVTDTFGERWSVPSVEQVDGASGHFKLFSHSDGSGGQTLLVPPVAATARSGPPLERVRFLRDEPAEMAWAIEETVLGPGGKPVHRAEVQRELEQRVRDAQAVTRPEQNPELTYRLVTPPPAWWIPLVPEQTSATSFALHVRELVDGSGSPLPPQGRVVVPGAWLADEEVPRTGVNVQRAARRTRWLGGRTNAWVGRQVKPGRVEGSSGLRWDAVDPGL